MLKNNIESVREQLHNLCQIGLSVIPVKGKKARVKWEQFKNTPPTADQIDAWINQFPNTNWAVITGGKFNLVVLDHDTTQAIEWRRSRNLPSTVTVFTSEDRLHDWYRSQSPNIKTSRKKIHPGVDVRANGGYVVIPPSIHASGNQYQWERFPESIEDIAMLPPDLEELVVNATKTKELNKSQKIIKYKSKTDAVQAVGLAHQHISKSLEGERNETLFESAINLRNHGVLKWLSFEEIEEPLVKASCSAGLPEAEALATIQSAFNGKLKRNGMPDLPPDHGEINIRQFPRNDSGNASLIHRLYGRELKYRHDTQQWLIWDNENYWEADSTERIMLFAKRSAMFRSDEGIKLDIKEQITWASRSLSFSGLNNALKILQSMPGVSDEGKDWDTNDSTIAFDNGVYDLEIGDLRNGEREDRISIHLDHSYNPNAKAPVFMKTLYKIMSQDKDMVDFLLEAMGYGTTGSINEQMAFIYLGVGANGKSLLLSVVRDALGAYGYDTTSATFDNATKTAHTQNMASLAGKRFVTASEVDENSHLNQQRFKQLTGDTTITARLLYKDESQFRNTCKFFFALNHLWSITEDSEAIWRRICVIPFNEIFTGEKADTKLGQKLKGEAEGILALLVSGAQKHYDNPIPLSARLPEKVKEASMQSRIDSDPLKDFIDERIEISDKSKIAAGNVQVAYKEWADRRGLIGSAKLSAQSLSRQLRRKFNLSKIKGCNYYCGFKLRSFVPDDDITP